MKIIQRNAFTMLELVFVIVIIGILSAVAIPKLAATRDDATIVRAKTTVAAIRSSISSERQQRILRGDFTIINALSMVPANVFDRFNPDRDDIAAGRIAGKRVLEYPVQTCATLGKSTTCWSGAGLLYTYTMYDGTVVNFSLANNRFDCTGPAAACRLLTQ